MSNARRPVLIATVSFFAALAAAVLYGVLGTVVFATTVAYLLVPIARRVEARGLSRWWAAAVTSVAGSLAALVPLAGLGYLLSERSAALLTFAHSLPAAIPFRVGPLAYTLDLSTVTASLRRAVAGLAVAVATALPAVALKFTVFAVLVFGLLVAHEDAEGALRAAVPAGYRDVADRLAGRARDTLYAIYVLQVATALATAAVAVPVFWLLGYPFVLTLAVLCGILQFLPVVGPSVVVVVLALYRASLGEYAAAAAVLLVAGVLVAWLPDPLVRPRLSRRTADLPGSLYFVGFTGGLLTLGPVGVIAGPLVVALLVEAVSLLADAENGAA